MPGNAELVGDESASISSYILLPCGEGEGWKLNVCLRGLVWYKCACNAQTLLLSYKITALHSEVRGNFRLAQYFYNACVNFPFKCGFRGWHRNITINIFYLLLYISFYLKSFSVQARYFVQENIQLCSRNFNIFHRYAR